MSRTLHHGFKAKDRIGKNDNWSRNEPKEWRRTYKHKKRRAEAKRCRERVMQGDEDVVWPLDSKPWIYYW